MWSYLTTVLVAMVFVGVAGLSAGLLFADSTVLYGLYALGLMGGLSLGLGLVISSWYGLVLLLVYLGGLMVMFGYFLAICPNQQGWQKKGGGWALFIAAMGVGVYDWGGLSGGGATMELMELFKGHNFGLLAVLAFMLLLVLVVVVKMVELKQGPLRPFF